MSGWENYYTAGYTVTGSSDVEVDRYCRSEDIATRKAKDAAVIDLARLRDLGIAGELTVWVRHWRTRSVYEHDDKKAIEVLTTERRHEIVELDR